MLNIDQIKKLKEKASASPWSNLHNGDHEADKEFLVHSHKIALTAIQALERVEELRDFIRRNVPDGAERRKVLPIVITNPPANN
jgi:hypothetical protein